MEPSVAGATVVTPVVVGAAPAEYKSTERARAAYQAGDVEMTRREHALPIGGAHQENHSGEASDYVKSIVFGGLDGIMTTFAIIAAAAGSNQGFATVLTFGFSNVIADGFSMGFGEYVSGNAERDHAIAERKREEWEVENCKDMEIEEMVEVYEKRGLSNEDARTVVNILAKDPKLFVDFMMVDELGLLVDLEDESGPLKQGCVMFLSFLTFGSVPLLAYLSGTGKGLDLTFGFACFFTAIALVVLGALKGKLTNIPIPKAALLMVFNGVVSGVVSLSISSAIDAAVT